MADYLKTADVWTVLDLIVAEFESDPRSVQCFDLRLVERAKELNREYRDDAWGAPGGNPISRLSARLTREKARNAELLDALKEAVRFAEPATNPSARMPNYEQAVAAIAKAEGR